MRNLRLEGRWNPWEVTFSIFDAKEGDFVPEMGVTIVDN